MLGWFKRKESDAERNAFIESATNMALQRAHAMRMSDIHAARRSFDAAETPAWTSSWESTSNEINLDLAKQLPTLRSRARELVRNNEWAKRYIIQLKDNVVGSAGIRLQMRLTKRNNSPDPHNDKLEQAWAKFCSRGVCEVSGKLTFNQVEYMVLESLAVNGEFLIRKRYGVGPFGFALQILNPALIDVAYNGQNGANRIRMGIEINDDGKPIAYYLRAGKSGEAAPSPYTLSGKHIRVLADEIIHGFDVCEVDQLRGVPWLSTGARRLWMLKDFEQAAAVASSNAAKRQGFFISPTGDAPAGFADTVVSSVLDAARAQGKVLTPAEIEQIIAAADKYSTTMPGQFDTLPQGYDFKAYESAWPNIDANGYIKQQVRGFAASLGMNYATLGNDLEAVNYSSARVGIIDEREHYKTIQALLISTLHEEVFKSWLPFGVLATPTLSAQRLDAYLAGSTWQARRWVGIDPLKEAKANETNLAMRLTSRRRIQLERGDDPDEIALEIAAEEELYGPAVKGGGPNQNKPMGEDDEQAEPLQSS